MEPAHLLEVAQIASRCDSAEETSGPLRWIAECMRNPDRHHQKRSLTGPYRLRSHQELQLAFEDVEALFVRTMDMRLRYVVASRREHELSEPQRTPRVCPILLHDHMDIAKPESVSFARPQDDTIPEMFRGTFSGFCGRLRYVATGRTAPFPTAGSGPARSVLAT